MTLPLDIAAPVQAALDAGRGVVALESTLIAHGLPWPHNLETARRAEAIIRDRGAVPATIAVLKGRLCVGLGDAQLENLARMRRAEVMKLSRADLAVALATGASGATTIAATMIAAHRAGISVFATGGIGGVHRGAQDSFDVSADLHELAQTPVIVVASGAKAILDLPATLEVLETLGVPVVACGQDAFPAFWSRDSGLAAPLRMDDPATIARAARMRRLLGLGGGMLVANPIPAGDEIPLARITPAIEAALKDAADQGIAGKPLTPFLLGRVLDLTGGASLAANIALILDNARLGADIALQMAAG